MSICYVTRPVVALKRLRKKRITLRRRGRRDGAERLAKSGSALRLLSFCESLAAPHVLRDVVEFLKGFARLPLMSPSGEMEEPGKVRKAASLTF